MPTGTPTEAPVETVLAETAAVATAVVEPAVVEDPLGRLCRYAILAETAITNTGTLDVIGNMGLSPTPFAAIVGFGLKLDSSKAFSKFSMMSGKVYAADYYGGTTTVDLAKDILAMEALYLEKALMPSTTTLTATSISGLVFTKGVYHYIGAITMAANTKLTLSGSADDVFVIQSAGGGGLLWARTR